MYDHDFNIEVWNSLEESTLRNAWKSVRGDMSREQATAEDRANVQSFFRELQSVVGEVDSLFPTGSQEDFYTSTHPGEHLLILPEMMSFVGTRMAVLADQEISQPYVIVYDFFHDPCSAPALPVAYDTTPNSEAVPHESNHGNAVCQVVANDLEIPLTVGPTGWAMYLGHEEDFYLQQASACLSIASRLNRENKRLREPAEE